MFPGAHYEGLPFVGRSRLTGFLARWDSVSPGAVSPDTAPQAKAAEDGRDVRDFLEEYFNVQKDAYHLLLNFVEQANYHLDYWLDWTTPIHHRPIWAYRLARRASVAYLVLLGRAAQVSAPSRAARQYGHLHAELCRLVAFIQISSFELLTAAEESGDAADFLEQAVRNLDCQARACRHVAALLDQQRVATADGTTPTVKKGMAFFRRPSCDNISKQVRVGFETLRDSQEALDSLARALSARMRRTGRLSSVERYLPPCAAVALLGLSWGYVALRDASARSAFVAYVRGVSVQFFREWVYDPMHQFAAQLFRRLSSDDLLKIQLKELRVEQARLEKMLDSFESVIRTDPLYAELMRTSEVEASDATGRANSLAEKYFERSMSNPISNFMQGHLLESCMVQAQRMKVLLYASLYSIDAVILQLKWDFLMAGVMPFMSLCGLGYWIVGGVRRGRHLGWRRRMVRALAEVDRYLNHHSQGFLTARRHGSGPLHMAALQSSPELYHDMAGATTMGRHSLASCHSPSGQHFGLPAQPRASRSWTERAAVDAVQALELEKVGEALGHLDALCRLASRVRLEATDWRAFRRDIRDLTSPELTAKQKLHVVGAMRATYHVFHVAS